VTVHSSRSDFFVVTAHSSRALLVATPFAASDHAAPAAIGIREKDPLPPITTLRDLLAQSGNHDAGESSHVKGRCGYGTPRDGGRSHHRTTAGANSRTDSLHCHRNA
jgi:hypothetical protein